MVYLYNNTYSFNHLSSEVDEYILKVVFPLTNGDPQNLIEYTKKSDDYEGMVELFSIIINATQVA